MAGVSAGAICWFNKGITDSWKKNSKSLTVSFINGTCCPHYDEDQNVDHLYINLLKKRLSMNVFQSKVEQLYIL